MKTMVVFAVCGLIGCASAGGGITGFPDPAAAHPGGGTFVNVNDLRQYGEGMSKQQLYALLGTPHFNEGMWGVREWNYLFQLRPTVGAKPVSCQFQIRFDGAGMAIGHAWQPASCGALLQPPQVAVASPPVPSKAPLRLSADTLFAFDSATLSADGHRALDAVLGGRLDHLQDVTVVGYADRLGAEDYNLDLSRRRAESVRSYLIQQGVPAAVIRAEGRGVADPLVQCDQRQRTALIACLAPNRRVEISGIAHD